MISVVVTLVVLSLLLIGNTYAKSTPIKVCTKEAKICPTQSTKEGCEAAGGFWVVLGDPKGSTFCSLPTADGGKKCKSNAACQSGCMPVYDYNTSDQSRHYRGYGICNNFSRSTCFAEWGKDSSVEPLVACY